MGCQNTRTLVAPSSGVPRNVSSPIMSKMDTISKEPRDSRQLDRKDLPWESDGTLISPVQGPRDKEPVIQSQGEGAEFSKDPAPEKQLRVAATREVFIQPSLFFGSVPTKKIGITYKPDSGKEPRVKEELVQAPVHRIVCIPRKQVSLSSMAVRQEDVGKQVPPKQGFNKPGRSPMRQASESRDCLPSDAKEAQPNRTTHHLSAALSPEIIRQGKGESFKQDEDRLVEERSSCNISLSDMEGIHPKSDNDESVGSQNEQLRAVFAAEVLPMKGFDKAANVSPINTATEKRANRGSHNLPVTSVPAYHQAANNISSSTDLNHSLEKRGASMNFGRQANNLESSLLYKSSVRACQPNANEGLNNSVNRSILDNSMCFGGMVQYSDYFSQMKSRFAKVSPKRNINILDGLKEETLDNQVPGGSPKSNNRKDERRPSRSMREIKLAGFHTKNVKTGRSMLFSHKALPIRAVDELAADKLSSPQVRPELVGQKAHSSSTAGFGKPRVSESMESQLTVKKLGSYRVLVKPSLNKELLPANSPSANRFPYQKAIMGNIPSHLGSSNIQFGSQLAHGRSPKDLVNESTQQLSANNKTITFKAESSLPMRFNAASEVGLAERRTSHPFETSFPEPFKGGVREDPHLTAHLMKPAKPQWNTSIPASVRRDSDPEISQH